MVLCVSGRALTFLVGYARISKDDLSLWPYFVIHYFFPDVADRPRIQLLPLNAGLRTALAKWDRRGSGWARWARS